MPGINNYEEIKTIGGYTVGDWSEFVFDRTRIENTEFIYLAIESLQVYSHMTESY